MVFSYLFSIRMQVKIFLKKGNFQIGAEKMKKSSFIFMFNLVKQRCMHAFAHVVTDAYTVYMTFERGQIM